METIVVFGAIIAMCYGTYRIIKHYVAVEKEASAKRLREYYDAATPERDAERKQMREAGYPV